MNTLFQWTVVVIFAVSTSSWANASTTDSVPKETDFSALTPDEIQIYQHGEIGSGSLVAGGLLGTVVGLGTGHIVYGMYGSKGWIFTAGELGSAAIMVGGAVAGAVGCSQAIFGQNNNSCAGGIGIYIAGALLYTGFRVWEIIDVWTIPSSYNSQYRAIQAKVAPNQDKRSDTGFMLLPLITSNTQGSHANYGFELSHKF